MIANSWYATAYEHSSGVTINFNPYESSPDPQSGGAITVNGQYDLPSSVRATQLFTEMTHALGNAGIFQPIPPRWWVTGLWVPGQESSPVTLQLNLDQFDPSSYDQTVDMGLTSWDGSAQATRSSEVGGVATTLVGVINKIATNSGVPFTANADITTGPFAGQIWPQLQGVIADVLKTVAGGLGVNVYYTPGTAGNAGVLGAAQPVVRLINAMHPKRRIVRPQFVPEVQVNNYRTSRLTNKVIYKASDVVQVTSGEDQDIVVQLQGTPIFSTIVQPTVVAAISPVPYTGPASPYCVYDADGFEAHGPWTKFGGKITVTPGTQPDELNIHIKAPFDPDNPGIVYSIAELDNPAFYITCGDGVQWNIQTLTFGTGAITTATQFRPADYTDPLLDNRLIVNLNLALCRGVAYIAQESAPLLTIDDVQFDNAVLRDPVTGVESAVDPATLAASKFKSHGAYYRFTRLQFTQPGTFTGAATECTTAQDFDNEFGNMTLLEYGNYLAAEYPDGEAPSFGTGPGQLPVGTPMDSGLAALVGPTLEQWAMEPLRTGS